MPESRVLNKKDDGIEGEKIKMDYDYTILKKQNRYISGDFLIFYEKNIKWTIPRNGFLLYEHETKLLKSLNNGIHKVSGEHSRRLTVIITNKK